MADASDVVCSDACPPVQQRFAITITIRLSSIVSVPVNNGDARSEGAIVSRGDGVIGQVLQSDTVGGSVIVMIARLSSCGSSVYFLNTVTLSSN